MSDQTVRGRCLEISKTAEFSEILIRNENEQQMLRVASSSGFQVGDLVEIELASGQVKLLTPNRHPVRAHRWMDRTLDPRRLRAIEIRTKVERGIREFFDSRAFRETRTPLLVPCPGMEPHIRPFRTDGNAFLPTSPEFAMKRLLVGGLERIYQICPAFRAEPFSVTHHPEFTMLEWYRSYAGYEEIMADVEELFESLAIKIHGEPYLNFAGKRICVKTPWPRLRTRDLFLSLCGVDLVKSDTAPKLAADCKRLGLETATDDTWDDLYFRIWLNLIEPKLPEDQAVLVTRYPASQAALSVVDTDPDGSRWARRFEAYAGGLELGNAFEELTDPVEQRRRFVEDMDLREKIYGPSFPKNPLDEGFLEALAEGMPPAGGIAMGVDRMVMLYADEPEIDRTLWLSSYYQSS